MAKFLYKFDSIKKSKDLLEKKVQKELAEIDLEIERCSDEFTKIENKKEQSCKNIQLCKKISELKQLDNYRNELLRQMEQIHNQINLLTLRRENKLNELVKKSQESKMFKRLEEVQYEEFVKEENQKEDKFESEIATQKFIREKK
jgi:flagellar export protein FliJ